MKWLAMLLALLVMVGCASQPRVLNHDEAVPPVQTETTSNTAETRSVTKVAVKLFHPPIEDEEPHLPVPRALPATALNLQAIEQVMAPNTSPGLEPDRFEVQSFWQVAPDLQVAAGRFTEALTPALVVMPTPGKPSYIPLLPNDDDSPVLIIGVERTWVLVRVGHGYQVFNYYTNEVTESDTSATPGKRTDTQPEEQLLPAVPRYPLVATSGMLPGRRHYLEVRGDTPANVLTWYETELLATGWRLESTDLPPDQVLLFSKEGSYLSLSGHRSRQDRSAILRFHLRSTREVTQAEAILIAKGTHQTEAEWRATLLRDYEMNRYGIGFKHPVWMVEALPGNDAVWVDALTGEPVAIRQ